MEAFVAFIAKYWLNFFLALLGASVTAIIVKVKERYKLGKQIQDQKPFEDLQKEIQKTLKDFKKEILETVSINEDNILKLIQQKEERFETAINKEDRTIAKEIQDSTQNYKEIYKILENSREVSRNYRDLYQKGLLYILRRSYFEDCEALLNPEHHITFEEFRSISEDHDLYNQLGGNHQGDILFEAIEDKYHKQT